MLDLAIHASEKPTVLADVARRQGISLSYLEQLFSPLRKQSLVVSMRGPGGGYKLARSASTIFVGEVIEAVDEQLDATRCGGERDCQSKGVCLTHPLWQDLSDHIRGYLHGVSLQDLVESKQVQQLIERHGRTSTRLVRRVLPPVHGGVSRMTAGI
jgi:Rrf2 family transcriptional regulator, iron-sulfur cluster assembly transcription factor